MALTTLLAEVAETSGRQFLVDSRVRGEITLLPGDAPPTYETLQALLRIYSFVAIESGVGTYVIPEAMARQMPTAVVGSDEDIGVADVVTRVVELNIESAAPLVPVLRPLMPQWGHMAAMENKLVLVDRYDNVQRIIQVARELTE